MALHGREGSQEAGEKEMKRIVCDNCGRLFDYTSMSAPKMFHRHFCGEICEQVWVNTWQHLYGGVAVGGREYLPPDPEQLELDLYAEQYGK